MKSDFYFTYICMCVYYCSIHESCRAFLVIIFNMLSFFRKLSIGGKIKDGILPEKIMGTAEDLLTAKNQSDLTLKTDTELKESVYGKLLRSICVLYHSTFRSILSDVRKMVRHCKWLVFFFLHFIETIEYSSKSISGKKYIAEIISSCEDFLLFNNSVLSVFQIY